MPEIQPEIATYSYDSDHPERPWFPGALGFNVKNEVLMINAMDRLASGRWAAEVTILVGMYCGAIDLVSLHDLSTETHMEFNQRLATGSWAWSRYPVPRVARDTDIFAIPGIWSPEGAQEALKSDHLYLLRNGTEMIQDARNYVEHFHWREIGGA